MIKHFSLILMCFSISCTKHIKVIEDNQTLVTLDHFPKKDTVISVKDYFITYREEGNYIVGSVNSPFTNGQGSFKSSSKVTIDISKGKLTIF